MIFSRNHGTGCSFSLAMLSLIAWRKMLKSGLGSFTPGNRSEMMPSNSGMSCKKTSTACLLRLSNGNIIQSSPVKPTLHRVIYCSTEVYRLFCRYLIFLDRISNSATMESCILVICYDMFLTFFRQFDQ